MYSFTHLHLDQITKTVLADYVSVRRAQGMTGATNRLDLATLSSVCSYAQAIDMIETNPVKTFPKRHIRDSQPRTSYLTDAEIEMLISHALIGMRRPVRFLAETGMRLEEAISLEWSQVTLHRREVRLKKIKTPRPGSCPSAMRSTRSWPALDTRPRPTCSGTTSAATGTTSYPPTSAG